MLHILNKRQIAKQDRAVFFLERRVAQTQLRRLFQKRGGIFQRPGAKLHKIRVPRRLVERLRIRLQALAHPALRVDAAAHDGIALCRELGQTVIIAPVSERIDHGREVRLLRDIVIELRDGVAQRLRGEYGGLLLVGDAEIRRKLRLRRVLPQDHLAERVYRGDLRLIQARQLPLQSGVFRVRSDLGRKPPRDLPAQLRGCGSGICDDEKFIQISRIVRVHEISHQALDEHGGLAGARSRRDEQRAAAVRRRRLLLRGQDDISHLSSSLQALPRILRR